MNGLLDSHIHYLYTCSPTVITCLSLRVTFCCCVMFCFASDNFIRLLFIATRKRISRFIFNGNSVKTKTRQFKQDQKLIARSLFSVKNDETCIYYTHITSNIKCRCFRFSIHVFQFWKCCALFESMPFFASILFYLFF